jgi:tetratricopeptide (TPR) repeat protein
VRGPIADLTATLITAWTQFGSQDQRGAIEGIDRLAGPEWYAIFKDLHGGLILDLAGNKKEAGKRLEKVYKLDPKALRAVEAYGRWASRNTGKDEALKIYEAFDKVLPQHPLILEAMDELKGDEKLPPLVDTPQAGAAEVLFGLGTSLGRQGGEDVALAYLQLAIYLAPRHPLALMSLADLYEQEEAGARAQGLSACARGLAAQAQCRYPARHHARRARPHRGEQEDPRAPDDRTAGRSGSHHGARQYPARAQEFASCGDVYGKAVNPIKDPKTSNWLVFYFRGICHERSKQWAGAEADFKKALELSPDQPHVLNYLGYSWIDQGINLDEGMRMIRRAVEQRPDDGYIVDSLGWAHYRIKEYGGGGEAPERAVELKPADPTINDHLGDAYWKTGRTLKLPMVACARPRAGAGRSEEDQRKAAHRPGRRIGAGRDRQGEEAGRRRRSLKWKAPAGGAFPLLALAGRGWFAKRTPAKRTG